MWYVIQTRTGFEHELVAHIERLLDSRVYVKCLVPIYEEVKRIDGKSRISFKKLFPGYVLIDALNIEEIVSTLRNIPEFTRPLGEEEPDGEKIYIPVGEEDMDFLGSILDSGVLRISYVEQVKGKRIKKIVGPLERYCNRISKIELRHRFAIVEAEVFGKKRRIKFGLWTDEDPAVPWIEERLSQGGEMKLVLSDVDIGIHPGDRVRDTTGMYGDEVFVVEKVNPIQRTIKTQIMMFGEMRDIELFADGVERV